MARTALSGGRRPTVLQRALDQSRAEAVGQDQPNLKPATRPDRLLALLHSYRRGLDRLARGAPKG